VGRWVRAVPEIPARRYCCFYPMDKKPRRIKNWYEVSIGRSG